MVSVKKELGFAPTSMWSLKKNPLWQKLIGDRDYEFRYQDSESKIPFSEFNTAVADGIIKIWSKEGDMILNPFMSRGHFLFIGRELGRNTQGYEIVKEYCDAVMARKIEIENDPKWNTECSCDIYNDDARLLKFTEKESVDMIATSPPFWKREKYRSCEGQMNDIQTYPKFMEELGKVWKRCYKVLKPGKFIIIESNFFRHNGEFVPFMDDIKRQMVRLGFIQIDEIIEHNWSYTARGMGMFLKKGFTPKSHAYLNVFQKPPRMDNDTAVILDERPKRQSFRDFL